MGLNIKYLGMLAEASGKEQETIELSDVSITALKVMLQEKYPKFVTMNFKVAVNHSLVEEVTVLKDGDEVALLPPFAGG